VLTSGAWAWYNQEEEREKKLSAAGLMPRRVHHGADPEGT